MLRLLPLLLACSLGSAALAQSADVSVSLSAPATVVANYDTASANVNVTISNSGPAAAANVTVDFSPEITTISLPLFSCSVVTNHIRCVSSSFPVTTTQGTAGIHLQQPADGTVVTLSATETSTTSDPNTANNTSSATTTVIWKSSLVLNGTDVIPTLPAGSTIIGTTYYENDGPSYATNVNITISMPEHTKFVAVALDSDTTFTCTKPPVGTRGDIVCSAPKVGNTYGSFYYGIEFEVTIDPDTPVGTALTFVATMTCSNALQPSQQDQGTVTVIPAADLAVSIDSPASVNPGDTYANTVTVTNKGPNAASSPSITFTFSPVSPEKQITAAVGPAGWNCGVSSYYRAICSIDSFPVGTATFSFPMSLSANLLSGTITESVSATTLSESHYADNVAKTTTTISQATLSNLALSMTGPLTANLGQPVTYTYVVSNPSANDATGVALEPYTIPWSIPLSWSCPDPLPTSTEQPLICSIGSLAKGASKTITVTFPANATGVKAGDSTMYVNGEATARNSLTFADQSLTVTVTIPPRPDASVAITATPSAVSVGDMVTFAIDATNVGEAAASNVAVHVSLPYWITFVSSNGACTGTTDVTCTIGNLAAGAKGSVSITGRPGAAGSFYVPATVTLDGDDPQPSNNSATTVVHVDVAPPGADVSVALAMPSTAAYDEGSGDAGAKGHVTVTNAGPLAAQNVSINFDGAASLTGIPGFSCSQVSGHVQCTASSLAPGSVSADLTGSWHNPAVGTVETMTATVSSASPSDPDTHNNSASANVTVIQSANLQLLNVGYLGTISTDNVDIPVSFINYGPSRANDIKLTFTIPPGLAFAGVTTGRDNLLGDPMSCTSPAIGEAGDVVCTLPSLRTIEGHATVYVKVQIPRTAAPGVFFNFYATLTSSDAVKSPQTATASLQVTAANDMAVAMTSPAAVAPGGSYDNAVTVTNNGPGRSVHVDVSVTFTGGIVPTTPPAAPGWTCRISSSTATCSTDSPLAAGESVTLTFPATAPASAAGAKKQTAIVTALNDVNAGNNTSVTTTTVAAPEVSRRRAVRH